jgi:hypothetical protein
MFVRLRRVGARMKASSQRSAVKSRALLRYPLTQWVRSPLFGLSCCLFGCALSRQSLDYPDEGVLRKSRQGPRHHAHRCRHIDIDMAITSIANTMKRIACILLALLGGVAQAETLTLSSIQSGGIWSNGQWNAPGFVGHVDYGNEFRSWYAFDLGLIPSGQVIRRARLLIDIESVTWPIGGSSTLAVSDVSTSLATLSGSSPGVEAFMDLGDDMTHGTLLTVTGSYLTPLWPDSLDVARSASAPFIVGLSNLTARALPPEANDYGTRIKSVSLTVVTEAVPEPGALPLFLLGLLGMAALAPGARRPAFMGLNMPGATRS